MYIDDILIHAQTEQEFLKSLKNILQRFRDRGLVLSPKKCSFGMKDVEILGHTINAAGSHFSREKLAAVMDIVLPPTGSFMRRIIALINIFQHVQEQNIDKITKIRYLNMQRNIVYVNISVNAVK